MKIIFIGFLIIIIIPALVWAVHYVWISLPVISGFQAKQMCTCMFVSGRDKKDLDNTEFEAFPLSLAKTKINLQEKSVTTTVFGMAKKKAIYRNGIGCTLINNLNEKEVRSQQFNLSEPPLFDTDNIPWPMGDKISSIVPQAINKNKLVAAIDTVFKEPYPDKKQRTRAVVVVYDGQLIAEKYAPGFYKNTKMYGWSMAKSITGALIGILVKQGKLMITAPAPVAEWRDPKDPRHAITIENLLQQTSGLSFHEIYTKASDVTNMLYKKDDMAAFAASHSLAHEPGTLFNYSSGNSNILSRIVKQTVGEGYASWPAKELFYKTGMHNSLLEPDAQGTYVGSSYICATARDYARFGLLYYNDGVCNGEKILPDGWVKQTVTAPAANKLQNYGYQFWLNGFNEAYQRKYPDAPADMLYCDGFAGQAIYIIPSKKLVIVRLGLTLDKSFNENEFIKSIIASIDDQQKSLTYHVPE